MATNPLTRSREAHGGRPEASMGQIDSGSPYDGLTANHVVELRDQQFALGREGQALDANARQVDVTGDEAKTRLAVKGTSSPNGAGQAG